MTESFHFGKDDVASLAILIEAFAYDGNLRASLDLYEDFVSKHDTTPHSESYFVIEAMIRAFGFHRHTEKAHELFEEAKKGLMGMKPSLSLYDSILEALAFHGNWKTQETFGLWKELDSFCDEKNKKINASSPLLATARPRTITRDLYLPRVKNEEPSNKRFIVTPFVTSYESLMKLSRDSLPDCLRVYHTMHSLYGFPSTCVLEILIDAFKRNGSHEEAEKWKEEAEDHGHEFRSVPGHFI